MARKDLGKVKGEDGKSAYQIWLEQGNTGTEQDFLNSLKANNEDIDLTGYATEDYVKNKIAEAQLEGGEVDLSGLATKDELLNKADKSELHTHENKDVLDNITQEKIDNWNNGTGGGTTYPIYFGTETPATDGSVLLWINTEYKEPEDNGNTGNNDNENTGDSGDTGDSGEITPFTQVGTVENTLTLNADGVSYDLTINSTGSIYGMTGFKRNGSYVTSLTGICPYSGINSFAYNPNASEGTDQAVFIAYWSTSPLGFTIPLDGTQPNGKSLSTEQFIVEDNGFKFANTYKITSAISGDDIVVTFYEPTTDVLVLTLTGVGLASKGFVPCLGYGTNANGTRTFKGIKF